MSKKVLSLTLTLALLLGALSCGFVMADAEVVAPAATAKDGYTFQTVADKDATYAAWLAEIVSRSNTLTGVTPITYDGPDFANSGLTSDGKYHQYCPGSSAGYLYDGNIPGINAPIDGGSTTNQKIFWETSKYPYLLIDLNGQIQLDQLLLAAAVGEGNFGTVAIYAGTDKATLVSAENMIAQESGFFGGVVTLDEPITARYVAIHFSAQSMARVSEIGIYSVTPMAVIRDGYTAQFSTDKATKDADQLKSVMARPNMLSSLNTRVYTDATLSTSANPSGRHASLFDGNIPGTTDAATSTGDNNKIFYNAASYPYLYYDLGGAIQMDQLLISSSVGEGTQKFAVYASDTLEGLISDENKIIDESSIFTAVFTMDAPMAVRYIAFHIVGGSNYARVSELAVYSKTSLAIDRDGYAVQTLPDKATGFADFVNTVVARPNMLSALNTRVYADATLSTPVNPSGRHASLFDGNIPGTTDAATSTGDNNKIFYNAASYPYLYYDLGGTIQMDQLLIGSSVGEGTQKFAVYASDTLEGLISDENKIIDESSIFTAIFTMDAPIAVRYIAFHIVGNSNYARVSELAVYSASLKYEDKDTYIVESFDSNGYADYIADVMAQKNLAAGKTVAVYAEDGTKGTLNDDLGKQYFHLTDGAIAGITDDNTAKDDNQKVHWNSVTSPYMFVDLGKVADIEQLLISGSYLEFVGYSTPLGKVKVYAGIDKLNLVNADNLIAEEDVKVGAIITLDEAVTARYIAIRLDASYGRVAELGIYGDFHKVQTLGAGIRNRNEDGSYGLRFAFSLDCAGIDYAGADSYVRQTLDENSVMIIDGVQRQVLDFGAIVSKDAASADQLTVDCNGESTKKVPANNLYDVEDGIVTFTAVVVNVPENYADTALSSRPYVAYKAEDGSVAYYYGKMITRSVNDVMEAAGLI